MSIVLLLQIDCVDMSSFSRSLFVQELLVHCVRAEHEQNSDDMVFLNSMNKISQLSTTNDQRVMLLDTLVEVVSMLLS